MIKAQEATRRFSMLSVWLACMEELSAQPQPIGRAQTLGGLLKGQKISSPSSSQMCRAPPKSAEQSSHQVCRALHKSKLDSSVPSSSQVWRVTPKNAEQSSHQVCRALHKSELVSSVPSSFKVNDISRFHLMRPVTDAGHVSTP